jgi:hypothetical protein
MLKFTFSPDEARVVFDHCDSSGDGRMDYLDFLDLVDDEDEEGEAHSLEMTRRKDVSERMREDEAPMVIDMDKWLGLIGLERAPGDVFDIFCEAVCDLLVPAARQDSLKDVKMLSAYFSSWQRRRELFAVCSFDDFYSVLDALGLNKAKFRCFEEVQSLKNAVDRRMMGLLDTQEVFALTNSAEKADPDASSSRKMPHPAMVRRFQNLLGASDQTGAYVNLQQQGDPLGAYISVIFDLRSCTSISEFNQSQMMSMLQNACDTGDRKNARGGYGVPPRIGTNAFDRLCCAMGLHLDEHTIKGLFYNFSSIRSELLGAGIKDSWKNKTRAGETDPRDSILTDHLVELLFAPLDPYVARQAASTDAANKASVAKYITISQFVVALCRVLLSSDYRENLIEMMDANVPKTSRMRRKRRQKAVATGDMGGKKVVEPEDAALKLQKNYRGW